MKKEVKIGITAVVAIILFYIGINFLKGVNVFTTTNTYYVKLGEDMISTVGDIVKLPRIPDYQEGPWCYKRGDNYYLIYAAGGIPEHISYSMSKSPEGPWEYKGKIMYDQNTGSFTNHAGIVNYKGRDYFFYHTGWLKGGGGFNRSISVEEFKFNHKAYQNR